MKLLIREITIDDIDIMYKWAKDEEIAYFSDEDTSVTYDQFVKRYNLYLNSERDNLKLFAVTLDGKTVGRVELGFDLDHRRGQFGIIIGEKDYWGKGIGKRALEALFSYGFEKLKLNRISCEVYDYNNRSINLMKSVGMILEARLKEVEFIKDKYVDLYLFRILKKEYDKQKNNEVK